mgnify:CR=1 FL=1
MIDLYKDYFQKSRIFLYPILGIRRGASVTPMETFLGWQNQYSFTDRKFICQYHLRDDKEFIRFEKDILLKHKLFFDFKQTDNKEGVYIFDFSSMAEDYDNVVAGTYSKLSKSHKNKIERFYGRWNSDFAYVESFLYPDKYYEVYSALLNVEDSVLRTSGELCSHIDAVKETLTATIKNFEFTTKNMSNLKTMLLVTVPYTPTENSFRMIPATNDCPYVDVVYWKDKKVLEITSTIKKSEYAMFPKLDDNGDVEMRKSTKTTEDGQKITHKQERRIAEVNTKYYIINKDEIDAFVAQVAVNSDTVDYKQYLNDTNLVKGNAPMEIIKP